MNTSSEEEKDEDDCNHDEGKVEEGLVHPKNMRKRRRRPRAGKRGHDGARLELGKGGEVRDLEDPKTEELLDACSADCGDKARVFKAKRKDKI